MLRPRGLPDHPDSSRMSELVVTRPAEPADVDAISALHDRVFGPGRFARTAYRVRENARGPSHVSKFCRVATLGPRIIASVTMSEIAIGGVPGALLLGPLVVDPEFKDQGYGRRLVAESVAAAGQAGRSLVVLVGDEPYYGRLGFARVRPGQISMPGPVNATRLLAAELKPGARDAARGVIAAA